MATVSYASAMRLYAERNPEHIAIWFGEQQRTRGELELRANRLARAYQRLGVVADDLVTIALPNGIEFLEACLAIWKLGATPQPVSSRLPEVERRAIVDLANPRLLIGAEPGTYGDHSCIAAGFEPDAGLSHAPLPDCVSQCARAMTSGGSTGRPKVILDTSPGTCNPDVAANGMQIEGTTLVPGPLYHAGPFITCWQALLSGGTAVVCDKFDAQTSLSLIERHRVDWVLFVPTMMQRIWRLPDEIRTRFDVSSLRCVMCTGAPSPDWLKRAWIDWLGSDRIFEAYGGSERIAGTLISGTEWLAHPGSVGKPTGDRRVLILGPDGNPRPAGEIGEVFMMPPGGQGSTYRYLGAESTATADGWESLGDLGYLDEAGYLYLVDRKTDMIVTGGANVYPAEVEAALDAHPKVRSSAVVGLPDEDLGQRIHAIFEALEALTDTELREHLADRLARYKIPRSFERVSEPLRDDAGKLRRSALRDARVGEAHHFDSRRNR
ncbi:MAG: AMP-binding protein [Myxococcota bacterium]